MLGMGAKYHPGVAKQRRSNLPKVKFEEFPDVHRQYGRDGHPDAR